MRDSRLCTREEVVKHDHVVAHAHESVDEVAADKARATSDEDALPVSRRQALDSWESRGSGEGDGVRRP